MTDDVARWAAQSVYGPDAKVGTVDVEKRINSTRLRVSLTDEKLAELFVKWTEPDYQQGHLEYGAKHLPSVASANQNMFRAALLDPIRAPKSLLSDDIRGLLVTEYVDGHNLKSLLAKPVRPQGLDPVLFMVLAGRALAKWHSITTLPVVNAEGSGPSGDANVKSFLDFSVWNILVARNGEVIYIIDFPGSNTPARRHRDLATFLHSLLVIKLHPMVIVNPRPWWSWQDTYAHFLASYSKEADIKFTNADYQLLQRDLSDLIRREIDSYRRLKRGFRRVIEAGWYRRLLRHPAVQSTSLGRLLHSTQETPGQFA